MSSRGNQLAELQVSLSNLCEEISVKHALDRLLHRPMTGGLLSCR